MFFILLIFLTAFLMEAIGTFISIVGLGAFFANDPIILFMVFCLDLSKVVTVSFLYQYWEQVKAIMKYYMLVAVIILMTITSAGAFGYLSGAFQKAIQPSAEISLKIDSFKHERDQLIAERVELTRQRVDIDKQIAQLPPDYVSGRQRLIASFKPESNRISGRLIIITKRIDSLNQQVLSIENENVDKQIHVGPILYVAKAFDITVEQASKWIILTIIFIFDPLAIILVVAGNFLIKRKKTSPPAAEEAVKASREPAWSNPSLDDLVQPIAEPVKEIKIPVNDEEKIDKIKNLLTKIGDQWKENHVIEISEPEPVPLTDEERNLLSLVYDDIDTGEEPSDDEADHENLSSFVKNYVPTNPLLIDVKKDVIFSGSPQAALIEEPLKSSLETLKINIPEALLQHSSAPSSKKALYE